MRDKEHIFPTKGKKRRKAIKKLINVYGYRCWYCGYRFNNDSEICIDHILPLKEKGTSDIENLALSCKFCNSHKFYYSVILFLKYLARIRTGQFECLILKRFEKELNVVTRDILNKSFYD